MTALPWGASHSLLEGGKHSLVKGMSGKGGHRNFVKSYIDPGILFDTLSRHDDLLPQFGAYDHVSRNQSIDPRGLLQALPLVKSLIKASPSCEIHSNPLRGALLQLVCSKPNLNTSKWNGTVWSNLRCERIGVVLHHMRRLKNSPEEVRKAAGKLTGAEIAELQNVVDSIVIAGEEPKRKLKKEISEVSLGSDGYPTEFKTPEQKGKGEGEKQPLLKGKNSAKKRSGQEALLKGQSACSASAAASSPPSFLRRRKGAMATNPPEERGPCHANPPEGRLKFWNVRTVPRVRVEPHPLQDLQGIRCERQAPWLTLFRLWKGWHCSAFERGNNSQSCLTVHDSHCARTFLQLLPYLWWCMMMSRFGSWF